MECQRIDESGLLQSQKLYFRSSRFESGYRNRRGVLQGNRTVVEEREKRLS